MAIIQLGNICCRCRPTQGKGITLDRTSGRVRTTAWQAARREYTVLACEARKQYLSDILLYLGGSEIGLTSWVLKEDTKDTPTGH
jgi:hypothetical protein